MPQLDSCGVRAKDGDFGLYKSFGPHSGGRHTFALEEQITFAYACFSQFNSQESCSLPAKIDL